MKLCAAFIFAVSLHTAAGFAADSGEPFAEGETWVYRHAGPVPYKAETAPATAYVKTVRGLEDVNGRKAWKIEHCWGMEREDCVVYYHDNDRNRILEDLGLFVTIEYEPPYPWFGSLGKDESREWEIAIKASGNEGRAKLKARRLADATVTVPAGIFENCRHVKVEGKSTYEEMGIAHTYRFEFWYHESANGPVRAVYEFEDGTAYDMGSLSTRDYMGFTATRELTEHKRPG